MKCTILRQMQSDGSIIQYWQGFVSSVNASGRSVQLHVPDLLTEALELSVPNGQVMRTCNRVLGDSLCRVDLGPFTQSTTMVSTSGTSLVVFDPGPMPDFVGVTTGSYYDLGFIRHTASGELRAIVHGDKPSKTMFLDTPFPKDMWTKTGSLAVELVAGCLHRIAVCSAKFANRRNFGGHPQLPISNPWLTTYLGARPGFVE
jgi:uncharacterized phage protein (TIGR02218 family)